MKKDNKKNSHSSLKMYQENNSSLIVKPDPISNCREVKELRKLEDYTEYTNKENKEKSLNDYSEKCQGLFDISNLI